VSGSTGDDDKGSASPLRPAAATGGVDEDIERLIVEAELAGRRTVADALARQLETRRAGRAAGNVISLKAVRSPKGRGPQ
jgi:hypothetical protein